MTDLKNYEVESPSGGMMTIQLSDAEAKARGLVAKAKKAPAPADKAVKKTSNKSSK